MKQHFAEDLRSIMTGEFSEDEPFQVLNRSGSVIYDSSVSGLSLIFEETFVLVGNNGEQIQSDYPRAILHGEVETEIGARLSADNILRIRGIDYPIRDRETDDNSMIVCPLRAPI